MDNRMKSPQHRLAPIEPPFSSEIEGILANYPQRDGYVLKLFRVFANSVRFLRKGTVNLLDRESPLPMREREMVILRVCANNNCEYEWGVHVAAFSAHVGFTEQQIAATRLGQPTDDCWPVRDQVLLTAVDDLCNKGVIEDATKDHFSRYWNPAQQLEVFALAGNYHTISFVANNAELEDEDFAAKFPSTPAVSLQGSAA